MNNKNLISILEKNIRKFSGTKRFIYEYWTNTLKSCDSEKDLKRFLIRLKASVYDAEQRAKELPSMQRKSIAEWRSDILLIINKFYL